MQKTYGPRVIRIKSICLTVGGMTCNCVLSVVLLAYFRGRVRFSSPGSIFGRVAISSRCQTCQFSSTKQVKTHNGVLSMPLFSHKNQNRSMIFLIFLDMNRLTGILGFCKLTLIMFIFKGDLPKFCLP